MYLAEVFAENFRVFGAANDEPSESKALKLELEPGLNVIVGENDSGKTAAIDAIRYCLWTTSLEYHRVSEDDFHCTSSGRARELMIRCKFGADTVKLKLKLNVSFGPTDFPELTGRMAAAF